MNNYLGTAEEVFGSIEYFKSLYRNASKISKKDFEISYGQNNHKNALYKKLNNQFYGIVKIDNQWLVYCNQFYNISKSGYIGMVDNDIIIHDHLAYQIYGINNIKPIYGDLKKHDLVIDNKLFSVYVLKNGNCIVYDNLGNGYEYSKLPHLSSMKEAWMPTTPKIREGAGISCLRDL
jgi:hypothetical protein